MDAVDDRWYKRALVYELSVRTYADSNGDGVGDFRGLTQKLDYLASIGVTALWLLPFQPSPWRARRGGGPSHRPSRGRRSATAG